MSELVSIITPCFNSEKYLDECITSVINPNLSKLGNVNCG